MAVNLQEDHKSDNEYTRRNKKFVKVGQTIYMYIYKYNGP